jgi:hypothetical protein
MACKKSGTCVHAAGTTRSYNSELSKMCSQSIDKHRLLAHQRVAGLVEHQNSLLLNGFDRNKPHRWPRHGFRDSLRVGCIRFAAFDIRLNIGRRHELHIVTKL